MSARPLLDELLARLPEARHAGGSDGTGVLPDPVRSRLRRDPAAALLWQRLVVQVRTLGKLPTLEAPADLEGRVVAAVNSGYLEERAVDHLASLERAEAPPALDARVRHLAERPFSLSGVVAPSVLDRLVELEVEDSRGLVARLIDRIVVDDRPRSPLRRILSRGNETARQLRRVVVATALLAAVGLGWSWFGSSSPSASPTARDLLAAGVRPGESGKVRFESVQPGDGRTLGLEAHLDVLTGGALGGRR